MYDVTRKKSDGGEGGGPSRGRGRGRPGADEDRGREAERTAREIQREADKARREAQREEHAAQHETQAALRAAQRETQAALRGAQRETQAALREAQREVQAAGRETEKASSARASALERAAAKVERVAAKVDGALAAEAAKQERLAARAEQQAAKLDRLAGYLGAIDVWTRVEPGGRKPRFTREDIAEAAIKIADEEGLDALSMRYLASQLGAGTMTLYHYVRTKDELMTLVTDAVMGEVVLPPGEILPEDWREACTVIAHRSRDVLLRHPWTLDIADDPPLGPNSVRHFDQTLAAVASLDIPLADRLDIVTCVDEYVFGFCLNERNNLHDGTDADDEMKRYVESLIAKGGYPQLSALAASMGLDAAWDQIAAHQRDDDRFERNLGRVLDGIEVGLARHGTGRPDPT